MEMMPLRITTFFHISKHLVHSFSLFTLLNAVSMEDNDQTFSVAR
jgi:hypothetical protein